MVDAGNTRYNWAEVTTLIEADVRDTNAGASAAEATSLVNACGFDAPCGCGGGDVRDRG